MRLGQLALVAAASLFVACDPHDGPRSDGGSGGSTGGAGTDVPSGGTSGPSTVGSAGSDGSGDGGGTAQGGSGGDTDPGGAAGASAIGAGGSGEGGGGGCERAPEALEGSVHEGDLAIASEADALSARAYSAVSGTIRVSPNFAGTLDLPNLLEVGGIHAEGDASSGELITAQIEAIRMPNLVRVRGTLWIYLAFELLEADFRKLETVDERFWIHRNRALAALRLDALRSVGQDVQISGNPDLSACALEMIQANVTAGDGMLIAGGVRENGCECKLVCGQGLCL